jgi:hypothetical protein
MTHSGVQWVINIFNLIIKITVYIDFLVTCRSTFNLLERMISLSCFWLESKSICIILERIFLLNFRHEKPLNNLSSPTTTDYEWSWWIQSRKWFQGSMEKYRQMLRYWRLRTLHFPFSDILILPSFIWLYFYFVFCYLINLIIYFFSSIAGKQNLFLLY